MDEIAGAAALRDERAIAGGEGGTFCSGPVDLAEARSEFKVAAMLTRNARERAFLLARADACDCKD